MRHKTELNLVLQKGVLRGIEGENVRNALKETGGLLGLVVPIEVLGLLVKGQALHLLDGLQRVVRRSGSPYRRSWLRRLMGV
jgi:hypothetical protein